LWPNLFRSGKFQVQITDPQSIEGGLPFRVFECAGCGVPLLSDHRTELEELFPKGSGLVTAPDEVSLGGAARTLFATAPGELAERGRRFHQHFRNGHTWEIRWTQAMRHLRGGAETIGLPPVKCAPLDAWAVVGA
jgi:spore maturation protein CgeB